MTDLSHLASRLYGSPLLLARSKLDTVLGVFERKLAGLPVTAMLNAEEALPSAQIQIVDGIAVIPVLGTLVRRSSYLNAASGLTSYHAIEAMAEDAFANPEVRAVLLEIDSSGGEAGGVFELSRHLKSLSQESGKPLWAIADEAALSAAYAIGCAADQLWLTPTAEVGSIGVVAVHVDQSKRDARDGLSYRFLHAGEHKVDANPHTPLTPDAAADIQHDVEGLYEQFIGLVAAHRPLAPQALRDTQARVYRGQAAIEAGLADRLGNTRSALAALQHQLAQGHRLVRHAQRLAAAHSTTHCVHPETEPFMPKTNQPQCQGAAVSQTPDAPTPQPNSLAAPEATPQPSQTPQGQSQATPAETIEATASVEQTKQTKQTTQAELTAKVTADVEARLRKQLAELTEIAAQAKRLGVSVDPAQALTQGITPDALRQSVLKQAAERDAAQDIVAQAPIVSTATSTASESPLVAAARRLAQQHGGKTV